MSLHLPVLTNSEMRTFRRCPREHEISYRLGIRPIRKADPLRFGSLIHVGLEAWWIAKRDGAPRLEAAIAAIRADESDPFELAKAETLLLGYEARWGEDETLDVLDVEVEFVADLVNPKTRVASKTYRLGGKIDVVARKRSDDTVWLIEHKSSSEDVEAGSAYWKKLRLDSQVSTYFVGARALGYDVRGCIYDVIKKPLIRQGKATPAESRKYTKDGRLYANQREQDETVKEYTQRLASDIADRPDRYFVRGDIVRLLDEEVSAAADAWMVARMMREADLLGRHPKNVDSCIRFNRECEYFVACAGEASLDDPLRYRRVQSVHEELGGQDAA